MKQSDRRKAGNALPKGSGHKSATKIYITKGVKL